MIITKSSDQDAYYYLNTVSFYYIYSLRMPRNRGLRKRYESRPALWEHSEAYFISSGDDEWQILI